MDEETACGNNIKTTTVLFNVHVKSFKEITLYSSPKVWMSRCDWLNKTKGEEEEEKRKYEKKSEGHRNDFLEQTPKLHRW